MKCLSLWAENRVEYKSNTSVLVLNENVKSLSLMIMVSDFKLVREGLTCIVTCVFHRLVKCKNVERRLTLQHLSLSLSFVNVSLIYKIIILSFVLTRTLTGWKPFLFNISQLRTIEYFYFRFCTLVRNNVVSERTMSDWQARVKSKCFKQFIT